MIKLLALDLDGTLLNERAEISSENLKAIEYAQSVGVLVTLCSGRPFESVRVFAEKIKAAELIVCCNGAEVRKKTTGEIVYADYMDRETCKDIIDISKSLGCTMNVYTGNAIITEQDNRVLKYYRDFNNELPEELQCRAQIVKDLMKSVIDVNMPVLKTEILDIGDLIRDELKDSILKIENINTAGSWVRSVEIMNSSAHKGDGLKRIAEELNFSSHEIMAVGDYNNDISMLEYVGVSVAMGNAEDCVKAVAKHVTDSHRYDGVAKAIYKFLK